jgi:hypothetical protein
MVRTEKVKKPLWKRWWVWVLGIIIIVAVAGVDVEETVEEEPGVEETAVEEEPIEEPEAESDTTEVVAEEETTAVEEEPVEETAVEETTTEPDIEETTDVSATTTYEPEPNFEDKLIALAGELGAITIHDYEEGHEIFDVVVSDAWYSLTGDQKLQYCRMVEQKLGELLSNEGLLTGDDLVSIEIQNTSYTSLAERGMFTGEWKIKQ